MIVVKVLGSLTLILGALLIAMRLVKKYVPSMSGARDLSIIEQMNLGDRCRVMVVKVRGKELLIGVTRESITILDTLGPQS